MEFVAYFLQIKAGNKQIVIDCINRVEDSFIDSLNKFRRIKDCNKDPKIKEYFLNSLKQ